MKTKIFLIISISVCISSCQPSDEFLAENPKGKLFPETFLNNKDELELNLTSIYKELTLCFTGYDQRIIVGWGSSDAVTHSTDSYDMMEFDIFQVSSGNTQGIAHPTLGWRREWRLIKTANAFINNYHNADGAVPVATLNEAAAQAHFARAFSYFLLVRFCNEIPLITTSEVSYTVGKSSTQEIYDLIIADLQFAEEWLPYTWKDHEFKKYAGFTKGAAKAMLAGVYLQMAGYPLNGGEKGEREYYRLAAAKAKEIIDNESTYGYKLLDEFDDLWQARPLINDEIIFPIIFGFQAWEDWQSVSTGARPVEYGGYENHFPEINFFNKFPAGKRKEATFVTTLKFADGSVKDWTEMRMRHPYYKKLWIDTEDYSWDQMWKFSGSWHCDRSLWVIRYAEVLLIYAEAQARATGTPDALAYQCMKRVRDRAGISYPLSAGLSGAAFADSVFVERGWEFAGLEFANRWFDLQRLELVEDAAKAIPEHSFLPGRHAWEAPLPDLPTKKDYFLPIPINDVLLNPNLAD